MTRARRGRNNQSTSGNHLVGWLVSYALEEQGKSYPLHTGRSLIGTEEEGNARQIILEDDSLSSPHSALRATKKHTLQVQDIFSGSGTYLQRGDSQEEMVVTGPIEVEHGDWLRFGENSRFQVCLIDGPGR